MGLILSDTPRCTRAQRCSENRRTCKLCGQEIAQQLWQQTREWHSDLRHVATWYTPAVNGNTRPWQGMISGHEFAEQNHGTPPMAATMLRLQVSLIAPLVESLCFSDGVPVASLCNALNVHRKQCILLLFACLFKVHIFTSLLTTSQRQLPPEPTTVIWRDVTSLNGFVHPIPQIWSTLCSTWDPKISRSNSDPGILAMSHSKWDILRPHCRYLGSVEQITSSMSTLLHFQHVAIWVLVRPKSLESLESLEAF